MTLGVIITVAAIMGLLYSLHWTVDRLLDRAVKQPPRASVQVRQLDHGRDPCEADPYFYGRHQRSTALAATRISAQEKSEDHAQPWPSKPA